MRFIDYIIYIYIYLYRTFTRDKFNNDANDAMHMYINLYIFELNCARRHARAIIKKSALYSPLINSHAILILQYN